MKDEDKTQAQLLGELAALRRRVAELEAALSAQPEGALEQERALLTQRVQERTAELYQANEELARASQIKDEFLAAMSHELRTPLHTILIHMEALQDGLYGPVTAKQQESLSRVQECGRQLLDMINSILDLTKIMSDKWEARFDLVQVEPACQASLRLTRPAAQKKQIHVSFTLDEAVAVLRVDERRLKQILVNLLDNAVKFSPEGGAIGLEVKGDADNQVAHFTVWDTGIGIAPQDLDKLFQPFVQLEGGLSRRYAGAGLGLTLVKRLAESYGGRISVTSQVDQGSRFTVTLPWHA